MWWLPPPNACCPKPRCTSCAMSKTRLHQARAQARKQKTSVTRATFEHFMAIQVFCLHACSSVLSICNALGPRDNVPVQRRPQTYSLFGTGLMEMILVNFIEPCLRETVLPVRPLHLPLSKAPFRSGPDLHKKIYLSTTRRVRICHVVYCALAWA